MYAPSFVLILSTYEKEADKTNKSQNSLIGLNGIHLQVGDVRKKLQIFGAEQNIVTNITVFATEKRFFFMPGT